MLYVSLLIGKVERRKEEEEEKTNMKVYQDYTGASCSTDCTPQHNLHTQSSPPVLWKKRDRTFNRQETKIPVNAMQALETYKALLHKRISEDTTPEICGRQEAI